MRIESTMYKHLFVTTYTGSSILLDLYKCRPFDSVCAWPTGLVKLTTWPHAISHNTCGRNVCIIILVSLRLICICMHSKLFPLHCAHKHAPIGVQKQRIQSSSLSHMSFSIQQALLYASSSRSTKCC